MTEPTDAELAALIDKEMREYSVGAYADHGSARNQLEHFARAVLAKWGARPAPASAAEFALQALVAAGHVSQELVDRALALPGAPQPVEREPLTHAQAKALVLKYGNDPLHLVLQVERAHGITGGHQ